VSLKNGISVRFSPASRERLERIASQSGIKASVLIRDAIEDYLDKAEASGKVSFSLRSRAIQAESQQGAEQTVRKKSVPGGKRGRGQKEAAV